MSDVIDGEPEWTSGANIRFWRGRPEISAEWGRPRSTAVEYLPQPPWAIVTGHDHKRRFWEIVEYAPEGILPGPAKPLALAFALIRQWILSTPVLSIRGHRPSQRPFPKGNGAGQSSDA